MNNITRLERILFHTRDKKADLRFFRSRIAEYVAKPADFRYTWNQLLDKMVLARNKGRDLKYCYYSNKEGRVVISKTFEDWAIAAREQIKHLLNRVNA